MTALQISSAGCSGSVEVVLASRPEQVLPFTGMAATLAGVVIVLGIRKLLIRRAHPGAALPNIGPRRRSALILTAVLAVAIAMQVTTV